MEKRQIPFPPNNSKKVKLDLPQNKYDPGPSKPIEDPFNDNTWDNEQIDEMILMASQACEVVENYEDYGTSTEQQKNNIHRQNNNISNAITNNHQNINESVFKEPMRDIADYVLSFKPPLTSTQKTVVCQAGTFKTPQAAPFTTQAGTVSLQTTSSKTHIVDGSGHTMQELQTSMVRLDRLKYEFAQLQDNYLSKEGEVAMLRSQLKNMQSKTNAERIQKLNMEERKMAECNQKVSNVEKELRDVKAQMEFQDLEMSKLREKCRMLEKGSKIKLTQPATPTPKPKWPSFGQKMDASFLNESHTKKVPPENVKRTDLYQPVKINVDKQKEYPLQSSIPECIFHYQPTKDIPVEYKSNREPLFVEHSSFMDIRRRILEEFKPNRSQSPRDENGLGVRHNNSCNGREMKVEHRIKFETIFKDLATLGKMPKEELRSRTAVDCALRICVLGKEYLLSVLRRLHCLARKVNPHTVKEMDEVYLAYMTNSPDTMTTRSLYRDSSWCDNEQAIDARRIIAVIAKICLHVSLIAEYVCGLQTLDPPSQDLVNGRSHSQQSSSGEISGNSAAEMCILSLSLEICKKIEYTGSSQRYPGLLSSISLLLEHCTSVVVDRSETLYFKILDFCKVLLMLRPSGRCVVDVLKVLEKLSYNKSFLEILCKNGDSNSNMVVDYSQGVALYTSDCCLIQLLCSQVEVWSSQLSVHIDTGPSLMEMTGSLLNLCDAGTHHDVSWAQHKQENKCSCCVRIYQCITVCLHHAAKLYLDYEKFLSDDLRRGLRHVLCSGLIVLKSSLMKDPDFIWRLKDYEGHYQMFVQILLQISHSMELQTWHSDALSELKNSLSLCTDVQKPDSPTRELWENMVDRFLLTD